MNTNTRIEPGLLVLFRLTIGFWLALYTLGVIRRFALVHNPAESLSPWVHFNALIALFLLLYLNSSWLRSRLGWWYLPIGLIITSMGPITVAWLDIVWYINHAASLELTIGFKRIINNLFFPLFISLIFIAVQYGFKAVLTYTLATAVLQLVPIGLIFFIGGQEFVSDKMQLNIHLKSIIERVFLFTVTGFLVVRVLRGQKTDRQALGERNVELARYATTVERLSVSHERNRMARELHDTLAHTLSAVSVQLEALNTQFDSDTIGAKQTLKKTTGLTRSGLQEVRRALHALRASPLEDLGLALALSCLVESTIERTGMKIALDISNELDGLRPEVEQSLYRITEEALNNATRHANAQEMLVSLLRDRNEFRLTVTDNGIGFDTEALSENGHYGITGMRERAMLCNSHLDIHSESGKGTTVHLTVGE